MKRTVAAEQFFTPAATVARCLSLLEQYYSLSDFEQIIEPSAGAGAFLEQLPPATRIGLDILPLHPEVLKTDFTTWTPPAAEGKVLTIGNPPFGRRAALAVQFVEKACQYSDVVAFILPRSFQKYTFQNRVPLHFHLIDFFDCDEFQTTENDIVQVKSTFQIWHRQSESRPITKAPREHADFDLIHAHMSRVSPEKRNQIRHEYEFAIPQVGADFTPRDPSLVEKGSHWFIKPKSDGVQEIFKQLDFSFLDGMNTAHKSLGKRDIIAAYTTAKAKRARRGASTQGD